MKNDFLHRMSLSQFIGSSGILLRAYAKREEDVESVSADVVHAILLATAVIPVVIVLVAKDIDCGQTVRAIKEKMLGVPLPSGTVQVVEASGNQNAEVLNFGMKILGGLQKRVGIVVSNKAATYGGNLSNIIKVYEAMEKDGALIAGLALRDQTLTEDPAYEGTLLGRVQNQFCAWRIKHLMSVGGFDAPNGCEEITPSVRMVRKFGPCIAPIIPHGQEGLAVNKQLATHNNWVAGTKVERQQKEAERVGADFDFLKKGIVNGYPK